MTKESLRNLASQDVPRAENRADTLKVHTNRGRKLVFVSGCDLKRVRMIINKYLDHFHTVKGLAEAPQIIKQVTFLDPEHTLPEEFFEVVSEEEFNRILREHEGVLVSPGNLLRYLDIENIFKSEKKGIIMVKDFDAIQEFLDKNPHVVKCIYVINPPADSFKKTTGRAYFTDIDRTKLQSDDSFNSNNLFDATLG